MFLHLFVYMARKRTEGESMSCCRKFPAHNTFKIGVLLLEQTRKQHDWEHLTSCAEHLQNWNSPVATTPQASRLRVTSSKLEFSSGRLPKTLLVSYVSLAFWATCLAVSISLTGYLAHPGKPRPRGNRCPNTANFQRVTPAKLKFLKRTRRSWLNISSTWPEYGPNIASKSLTWINIGPTWAPYTANMVPTWSKNGVFLLGRVKA